MEVSCEALSTLPQGKSSPPGAHGTGGWVGPKVVGGKAEDNKSVAADWSRSKFLGANMSNIIEYNKDTTIEVPTCPTSQNRKDTAQLRCQHVQHHIIVKTLHNWGASMSNITES